MRRKAGMSRRETGPHGAWPLRGASKSGPASLPTVSPRDIPPFATPCGSRTQPQRRDGPARAAEFSPLYFNLQLSTAPRPLRPLRPVVFSVVNPTLTRCTPGRIVAVDCTRRHRSARNPHPRVHGTRGRSAASSSSETDELPRDHGGLATCTVLAYQATDSGLRAASGCRRAFCLPGFP